GPVLEEVAGRREGDVVLAKVDTDANPAISARYGIQGIPAVKAFRDGRVVDEFVGVQARAVVERFFDDLVPSPADALVAAGDEDSLRAALALEPGRADATLALARRLVGRGDHDEALSLLGAVVGDFQADGLAARLRLAGDDRLAPALAALGDDQVVRGLNLLLEAVPHAGETQDDIRRVIVGELDRLGADDPLARDMRRRLAAALY
ncbi:MAG TPA: tetratricopeptide repeat protein, partial [Solirubrobacteraceae bacterium]|nr:tetratricopeptide repeat protein [Solirubrobacteraceae bacterium]